MCQSLHAMYEGKNIHYSAVDNKPLCSFSSKLCNQRRLNGYAFCVRHILEDPTAPFKRCAYVAKSSNQMCTQPIPRHEERLYCNNHMQVLGMLPRKERKKKEKDVNVVHQDKLSFQDRVKSKYVPKIKNDITMKQVSVDDPDDPYAFPDPVKDNPSVNSVAPQPTQTLEVPKQPQPSPNRAKSPGDGGSTIAKLYPELAEKLEKIKPKVEPKVKGRIRSSRTMNKLQTKIAQNKIKDKLRRSQESGSNPSVSPASLPSPDPSPVASQQTLNFVAGQSVTHPPPLIRIDGALPPAQPPRTPIPPHQPINMLGLSDVNHTLSPLAARLSPQVLPPPYPGPTNRPPVAPPASLPLTNIVQQQQQQQQHTAPVPPPALIPQTTYTPPTPVAAEVRLPPPPPYVARPEPPALSSLNPTPCVPVLSTKPQRSDVIVERVPKPKVKTNSAKDFYSCCVKRKKYNSHFANSGLCTSSEDESEEEKIDMLPWQPEHFSASSDEDNEEEQDGSLPLHVRATKLALLRAKLRRQCYQSRRAAYTNTSLQSYNNESTLALIKSARDNPKSTVKTLWEILKVHRKPVDKYKLRGTERRPCLYNNDNEDEDEKCSQKALPFTNHCLKHIMYNVDQQLFDYCTAKFADNTQCCVPVFDIRHGLPLCAEHGAKVDNHQKIDVDIKKRPRKKTKPPALTRPPKKGKKKKKNRSVRPQKPIPPSEPIGDAGAFALPVSDDEGEEADIEVDPDGSTMSEDAKVAETVQEVVDIVPAAPPKALTPNQTPADPAIASTSSSTPATASTSTAAPVKMEVQTVSSENSPSKVDSPEEKLNLEQEGGALSNVPLEEMLPASGRIEDIDKTFELPLEQASRLLEEQDFQDVFNKIPDEAFDIFSGKNGEFVPTIQETEELERALAAATSDVCSAKNMLEKLVRGEMSDDLSVELTRTLAETLLAHNSQNNAMDNTFGGEILPPDLVQEGINVLSRNLMTGGNSGFGQGVPVTANSAILNRLQGGMAFSQNQSVTVPYNGAVTSGNGTTSGGAHSSNIAASLAPGFQTAALSVTQNISTTPANRTTITPQRALQNSQGVAHAGFHGNLPYSALSQQLAMSQQTPKGQAIASPASVGQLHLDSSHVLAHSNLPPTQPQTSQQPLHSQNIISQQLGSVRPPWQPVAQSSGTSVSYQNGFPGPVTQASPFIQTVNIGNQVAKFPANAQNNLTEFAANKQDPHFAAASIPHSIGVAPIRPPVQGFVTNFTSGMPPFTSSSSGS